MNLNQIRNSITILFLFSFLGCFPQKGIETQKSPFSIKSDVFNGVDLESSEIKELSLTKRVVALVDSRNNKIFCSAFLISERSLVTAAHCLYGKNAENDRIELRKKEQFGVYLGYGTLGGVVEVHRKVQSFKIDPRYQNLPFYRGLADLAVIRLERRVPEIPLWDFTQNDLESLQNATLLLMGFGLSDAPERNPGYGVLRVGEMKLAEITTNELILAPHLGGPCFGDSGGPLLGQIGKHFYFLGTVSRGKVESCLPLREQGEDLEEVRYNFTNIEDHFCFIRDALPEFRNVLKEYCPSSEKMSFSGIDLSKCLRIMGETGSLLKKNLLLLKKQTGSLSCQNLLDNLSGLREIDLSYHSWFDLGLLQTALQLQKINLQGTRIVDLNDLKMFPALRDVQMDFLKEDLDKLIAVVEKNPLLRFKFERDSEELLYQVLDRFITDGKKEKSILNFFFGQNLNYEDAAIAMINIDQQDLVLWVLEKLKGFVDEDKKEVIINYLQEIGRPDYVDNKI